jgi:hypothetical protein
MPFVSSQGGVRGYGRAPTIAAPTGLGGSMSFTGTTSSFLSITNDADFRFGTGDFTIEWFQNMTAGQSFPRVFSMGSFPSATCAVSIESGSGSGTFYFWIGGGANSFGSVSSTGAWHHFAITRSGTSVRVFYNGTQLGTTLSSSYNFNDTSNALTIGNEGSKSAGAAFKGFITNFNWVKGTAKYTSNFTKPAAPLTASANTKLLLLASTSGTVTTDSSAAPKTVSNTGVTFSSSTPF